MPRRIQNKSAAVIQDANGLTFEDQAKLVGQKGQQDFIGQLGFGRVPVNIEMAGIVGTGPVLQHIPPPQVRGMGDAHVVGHDVDDQAHAALLQALGECGELFLRTDFGIEASVVGDVVAVHAAGMGHQKRGGVAVGDSQIVQIRNYSGCLGER